MNHHQTDQDQKFIFEDRSSFMSCDSITTQCAKIPQRIANTRRVSVGDSNNDGVDEKKKDIDAILSTAMKGLTVQERNAALEEVNGIVDNDLEDSNENPAVMDRNLLELDRHLQAIKSGSVYETAESMDPDYVQDRKFRIMFLRGQRYDPKQGAEQLLKFFDTKLWLWGKEKLCKDITLQDLSEEERQLLGKGMSQVLKRDVGGRMICTYLRGIVKDKDIMMECRCKYYTLMSLLESEETQKKGVIALLYVVGDYYKDKKGGGWDKLGRMAPSLPLHWAGFHFCCDNTLQYVLIRAAVLTFPKHLAAKFRCHKGTHLECMYSMKTFGIPAAAVPIPDTGANKPPLLYQHTIWYRNRERIERERLAGESNFQQQQQQGSVIEEENTTANIILDDDGVFSLEDPIMEDLEDPFMDGTDPFILEDTIDAGLEEPPLHQEAQAELPTVPQAVSSPIGSAEAPLLATSASVPALSLGTAANTAITPRSTDVLFGAKYMNHPGTLHLQQVVSQQLPNFESIVHRAEKTKFVGMMLQYMKASGTRFLAMQKATNTWIEVDDKIARNKVSKAFRNKRRTTGIGPSFFES